MTVLLGSFKARLGYGVMLKKTKLCYITKEEPVQVRLPCRLTCSACHTSFTVEDVIQADVPPNRAHMARRELLYTASLMRVTSHVHLSTLHVIISVVKIFCTKQFPHSLWYNLWTDSLSNRKKRKDFVPEKCLVCFGID